MIQHDEYDLLIMAWATHVQRRAEDRQPVVDHEHWDQKVFGFGNHMIAVDDRENRSGELKNEIKSVEDQPGDQKDFTTLKYRRFYYVYVLILFVFDVDVDVLRWWNQRQALNNTQTRTPWLRVSYLCTDDSSVRTRGTSARGVSDTAGYNPCRWSFEYHSRTLPGYQHTDKNQFTQKVNKNLPSRLCLG